MEMDIRIFLRFKILFVRTTLVRRFKIVQKRQMVGVVKLLYFFLRDSGNFKFGSS